MIKTWLKYILTEITIDTFFNRIITNFNPQSIKLIFDKNQTYNTIITRFPYTEFNDPRWVYTIYHECKIIQVGSNYIDISFTESNGYDCKTNGTDVCPYPTCNPGYRMNITIDTQSIVNYTL